MTYDLSVLIPARQEQFLGRTIQDVLDNSGSRTEIIAVLDGEWDFGLLPEHERVSYIRHKKALGQRTSCNEAARRSKAKYVMKLDAHCAMDKGFDEKLLEEMRDDYTMVPVMKNLHAFSWRCLGCGNETYQGVVPEGCEKCDVNHFQQVVKWIAKPSPNNSAYRFNSNLRFKYFPELKRVHDTHNDPIVETMSLQGSCFLLTREKYWELNICDETWGNWGQQGSEVALKTWLSGGRVVCNRKTWYAHLFRTQDGFSHPWGNPGGSQQNAIRMSQEMFFNNQYEKQVRPLSWLLEKFWPQIKQVQDPENWTEEDLARIKKADVKLTERLAAKDVTKGVVYYTDGRLDLEIAETVRQQIKRSVNGHSIVSVSLTDIDFGQSIKLTRDRGILTMFMQILAGLERSEADIVFLCEHDVLYHPSHFEFTPPRKDVFYYNENTYKVDLETGQALFYYTKQTSGLCAYRSLLIEHYRKRIEKCQQNARDLAARGELVKNDGFSRHMGFEPGCHQYPRGVDNYKAERWMSAFPNIDIRHNKNLTPSRWSQDQFRDPNACLGWTESDEVPGWGVTKGRFKEMLQELRP
jgi:glycosyltransferase involved in cell wall biosynthesis